MTMLDEVQARLDSYKTNKQRLRRIKELRQMTQETGFGVLENAIEYAALRFRMEKRHNITAAAMAEHMRSAAASGELPLYVSPDGEPDREPVRIPPEKFRLPH